MSKKKEGRTEYGLLWRKREKIYAVEDLGKLPLAGGEGIQPCKSQNKWGDNGR